MLKVHDALDNFLLAKTGEVAESTVAWYKSLLTPMVAYLREHTDADDISAVTIYDLRRWRAHIINKRTRYSDHPFRREITTRGYSIYTIRGKINACRIFFNWLHKDQLIDRNPSDRLHPPSLPKHKEPKAIPDCDIRKLVREAYRRENPRDVALIFVLADTGARVGGIAGLRIRDLELATETLIVTEKGDKTRPVYLTRRGVQAMRNYLRVRPDVDHNYVWVSLKKTPLTTSGIYKVLERLGDATGVEIYFPHSFRHAAARESLRNGASLERVSKLMGHEDVKTTADCYGVWTQTELHDTYRQVTRKRDLWHGVGD